MLATLVSEADYYPPIETILCSEISEADKSSSGNRGGRSELSSAPANIEASIVQTVVKESSVPATSSRVVKPVTKTVARYAASKRTKRCVKYRERRKEGQLTVSEAQFMMERCADVVLDKGSWAICIRGSDAFCPEEALADRWHPNI